MGIPGYLGPEARMGALGPGWGSQGWGAARLSVGQCRGTGRQPPPHSPLRVQDPEAVPTPPPQHFLQLEQVGGQLSASLLHSHDTETRATMTMALAGDFIAAGQDADCHILRFSLQPPPGRGTAGRDGEGLHPPGAGGGGGGRTARGRGLPAGLSGSASPSPQQPVGRRGRGRGRGPARRRRARRRTRRAR